MMLKLTPKMGLEGVEFGCLPDAVQRVYGEPADIHTEAESEVFEYTDQGLAFFFDGQSTQLNEIEIEEKEVSIWGVQLMFASVEEVSKVIKENASAIVKTMQPDEKLTYLFIETLGLTFSFEDKALVTVSAEA